MVYSAPLLKNAHTVLLQGEKTSHDPSPCFATTVSRTRSSSGGDVRDGFRYVEVDFGNLVKVPTKAGKHFEFVRVGFGCHAGPFRWAEERFLRAV